MPKIIHLDDIIKDILAANPDNPRFTIENILLAGKEEAMSNIVEQVFLQSGYGSVKAGITRGLWGINFAGGSNNMPINRSTYGLTFFTKPMMNMTTANLSNDRIMAKLLNPDENSVHRLIRASLDTQSFAMERWDSPFVNPRSPFIPILSNNLLSMSGWPDLDSQTYTSSSGNWREEVSFVDGIIKDFRAWDATCSFKNIDGNIITDLFFYWCIYMAAVSAVGNLAPYPVLNLNHEIDYNTAIYRINLDSNWRKLTGIARTIAFPITCPKGSEFNFERDRTFNTDNDQVSISFRCHGAEYNDDILIREFNRAVELTDPDFTPDKRPAKYVQIPHSLYRIFNGLAQPCIDEDTYELEWWVPYETYQEYSPLFTNGNLVGMYAEAPENQVRRMNPRLNQS